MQKIFSMYSEKLSSSFHIEIKQVTLLFYKEFYLQFAKNFLALISSKINVFSIFDIVAYCKDFYRVRVKILNSNILEWLIFRI